MRVIDSRDFYLCNAFLACFGCLVASFVNVIYFVFFVVYICKVILLLKSELVLHFSVVCLQLHIHIALLNHMQRNAYRDKQNKATATTTEKRFLFINHNSKSDFGIE